MSSGFVHSIPVPRLYKTAAKTVRQVTEEGASLKQLIYEKKHPNLKGVYALATTTLHNAGKLNQIIRQTQLLFKEPRLDPWLARVLITELIWGKGAIRSDSKPIQTILTYEPEIRNYLQNSIPESAEDEPKKKDKKPRYVRINTLVKGVEDAIEGFRGDGWELLPRPKSYQEFLDSVKQLGDWPYPTFIQDYHVDELFAFPAGTQFYDHPGYQCGAIVLQDKASCLPAYLLNPKPLSVVLDMCAAPGMKTTHLAAILQNRGKVISVERNERRYQVLCDMVSNANAHCVQTLNDDALNLTEETCPDVEYILVDPSCSGSGMDRPDFENDQGKCAPARLKRLQSFQVLLLRHALSSFPSVKRVIYSTCSMYPEENEMVVDEVLATIGNAYNLVPIKQLLKNQWLNLSDKDYTCADKCLYARPDIDYSNGFFVAVFERDPSVPLPEVHKKRTVNENSENDENGQRKRRKVDKKNRHSAAEDDKKIDDLKNEIVDEYEEKKNAKKLSKKSDKRMNENEAVDDGAKYLGDMQVKEGGEKKCKKKKRSRDTEVVLADECLEHDIVGKSENIVELSAEREGAKSGSKSLKINSEGLEVSECREKKWNKSKRRKQEVKVEETDGCLKNEGILENETMKKCVKEEHSDEKRSGKKRKSKCKEDKVGEEASCDVGDVKADVGETGASETKKKKKKKKRKKSKEESEET